MLQLLGCFCRRAQTKREQTQCLVLVSEKGELEDVDESAFGKLTASAVEQHGLSSACKETSSGSPKHQRGSTLTEHNQQRLRKQQWQTGSNPERGLELYRIDQAGVLRAAEFLGQRGFCDQKGRLRGVEVLGYCVLVIDWCRKGWFGCDRAAAPLYTNKS